MSDSLPAILCLHGSGSNAQIFTYQLTPLTSLLSNTFTFIHIAAPFPTKAGTGILPFFEGSDPFLRWKNTSDDNIFSYEEIEPEVRKLIQQTLASRDDWIGILGFSQGGRMAAGLLAEQERREEEDVGYEGEFKFGVLFNTPEPPMSSLTYEKDEEGLMIRTPSVLVRGKKDSWYESCGKMFEKYFDGEESKLLEFDVEHRVPGGKEDMKTVAWEILGLYLKVTGVRGKLNT